MVVQPPPPRAMVFVDGSNFYHRLKRVLGSTDLRYGQFIEWLGLHRDIVQLFYYVGEVTGNDPVSQALRRKQEQFLDFLRRTPLVTIRLGYTQRTAEGWEEKGVDTFLASDLVGKAHRNEYDEAIVISADGDLVPSVIEVRQEMGKKVYLAQFSSVPAYRLRRVVDGIIDLDCAEVRACLRTPPR